MNELSLYASAIVSVFLWLGCQRPVDSEIKQTVPDKPLIGTEWDLKAFEDPVGVEKDIGSEGVLLIFHKDSTEGRSLIFDKDSTFEGRSYDRKRGKLFDCRNSYTGTFTITSNGSIFIDNMATTKVNPIAGSRYFEYFYALPYGKTAPYKIKGDELRIFYDNNTKALRFKANE